LKWLKRPPKYSSLLFAVTRLPRGKFFFRYNLISAPQPRPAMNPPLRGNQ